MQTVKRLLLRLSKRLRYHASMGPANFLFQIKARVLGHQTRMSQAYARAFDGHGLEVGGASDFFRAQGGFPVYETARRIDNVTYGTRTHWEGSVAAGQTFVFHPRKAPGHQFIAEAGDLQQIPDGQYDFVISSHMLEHSANPIRALKEWKRVLKPDGFLLLVLPHRDGTFDHLRPVTTLEHLVEDERRDMDERDATHLDEILRLHDLSRDPGHNSPQELRAWIEDNFRNRGAHHHVFDALLTARLLDHLRWQILDIELVRPHHICALARKVDPAVRAPNNGAFLDARARYLRESPFPSDRAVVRRLPSGL